jgi:TonB family protein
MVSPVYPPEALKARIRGVVVLDVLVSSSGSPLEIRVIEGARAGLTQAAVAAVRDWEFEPALRKGAPVATWTTVRIPFEAIPFPTAVPSPPPGRAATPTPSAGPSLGEAAVPTPSPLQFGGSTLSVPPPWPPEPPVLVRAAEPDSVYRTRRFVRFAINPDQARLFVDGRYVGIARDWDDRRGGLPFELRERGPHRVQVELPGFDAVQIEIDVTATADSDVVAVLEQLVGTRARVYARLPPIAAKTRGLLALRVEPPEASVSVNGQDLGPSSAFSKAAPLRLPAGQAVHDLIFSFGARRSKEARVLVSPEASQDLAVLEIRVP